ncbi:hypothetical protein BIV57_13305 [Mangrovactinospora gilvigrisea]|uniref:Uncharacterized protein n=1 Tax=Mangrovactinospora gilvigrisea TaxID=1428644 RepID=A0A1J7BEG6_9ACTN|nr:hypothetical protein [Mangrovactinospora gilvigrisea]OIV36965.1 hypothetical protein BIV57_13305 [Mangrovactinospora gilvigrisea]
MTTTVARHLRPVPVDPGDWPARPHPVPGGYAFDLPTRHLRFHLHLPTGRFTIAWHRLAAGQPAAEDFPPPGPGTSVWVPDATLTAPPEHCPNMVWPLVGHRTADQANHLIHRLAPTAALLLATLIDLPGCPAALDWSCTAAAACEAIAEACRRKEAASADFDPCAHHPDLVDCAEAMDAAPHLIEPAWRSAGTAELDRAARQLAARRLDQPLARAMQLRCGRPVRPGARLVGARRWLHAYRDAARTRGPVPIAATTYFAARPEPGAAGLPADADDVALAARAAAAEQAAAEGGHTVLDATAHLRAGRAAARARIRARLDTAADASAAAPRLAQVGLALQILAWNDPQDGADDAERIAGVARRAGLQPQMLSAVRARALAPPTTSTASRQT